MIEQLLGTRPGWDSHPKTRARFQLEDQGRLILYQMVGPCFLTEEALKSSEMVGRYAYYDGAADIDMGKWANQQLREPLKPLGTLKTWHKKAGRRITEAGHSRG